MKKITFTLSLLLIFTFGFAQKPEMVFVEGGTYFMGNDYSSSLDEKPEHKVTLSDFYISKYEVTFDMFDNFCNATGYPKPDDGGYGRGKRPVINVSWLGAVKYCNWLSTRFGYDRVYELKIDSNGTTVEKINWDANGYRLPTEAEWEYVAKGGSKSQGFSFPGSNDPTKVAWFSENSDDKPHPVGTLKPNELGIYDLSGNAWEWCNDYYSKDYYKNSPTNDPKGPTKGDNKVYRGGNFKTTRENLRITSRYSLSPNLKRGLIGIRLVQNANAKQK
jgi:formylglycine-generating enzyme required for sulfatase activity